MNGAAPGSINDIAFHTGRIYEREGIIQLLKDHGAIRDSMIHFEWAVLYTESGPIDIRWSDIRAAGKSQEDHHE